MSSRPVAFLDSGIGGIPYLLAARRLMPGDRFAYFADNGSFPYGERRVDELREIVGRAVGRLIELVDPRAIVIACNTASVVALASLRERYRIPFVGVVPAIKPAAELARRGRIGVLATRRTVEDPYVSRLIEQFAADSEVVLVAAGGLIDLIERSFGAIDDRHLDAALEDPVRHLKQAGVRSVVLGCTHFIHVRDRIASMLGESVTVVDSVDGVVRQTARVAGTSGDRPEPGKSVATPLFMSSLATATDSYRYLSSNHEFDLCDAYARHSAHR